jgi:hypothetical protein
MRQAVRLLYRIEMMSLKKVVVSERGEQIKDQPEEKP